MPFGLVSLGSSVCCVQLQQRLPASLAMTQPAHDQEAAIQHAVPSSASLKRPVPALLWCVAGRDALCYHHLAGHRCYPE